MKKNTKLVINLIIGMLIVIGCGLFYRDGIQKQASFTSSFNIHKLTDKEYEEVGTSRLGNPIKDDFRKAVLRVEMQHTSNIKNREIIVPTMGELKDSINLYDIERYWFGNYYEQDNESEDSAEYAYEFIFYSKGLSNDDIKRLVSNLKISTSWVVVDGSTQKENHLLSDIINFNQ